MKLLAFVAAILCFAVGGSAAVPERYWLASRYNRHQAMIYFDTVHFGDSWPKDAEQLYPANGFGIPSLLTPAYVNRVQNRPGAVHLAIRDKYDLLTDGDFLQTATVTKLVGWLGDEFTGNDSYIGALVNLESANGRLDQPWFVATPHVERRNTPRPARPKDTIAPAQIESEVTALLAKEALDRNQTPPEITVRLLNSLDLSDGRTGSVVECSGYESTAIRLIAYKAGSIKNMQVLQTLLAAE